MQLKNNTLGQVQFLVRRNPNEIIDADGKKVPAKPRIDTITIPAQTTVEVDDALWLDAVRGTSVAQGFEATKETIESAPVMGKRKLTRTLIEPTGKNKSINLIEAMIKNGDLAVVQKPARKETHAEMRALLKEAGMPLAKDASNEMIEKAFDIML